MQQQQQHKSGNDSQDVGARIGPDDSCRHLHEPLPANSTQTPEESVMITLMRQLLEQSKEATNSQKEANQRTADLMEKQTEALADLKSMYKDHETRLERQQERCDRLEMRLKMLETLHEKRHVPLRLSVPV